MCLGVEGRMSEMRLAALRLEGLAGRCARLLAATGRRAGVGWPEDILLRESAARQIGQVEGNETHSGYEVMLGTKLPFSPEFRERRNQSLATVCGGWARQRYIEAVPSPVIACHGSPCRAWMPELRRTRPLCATGHFLHRLGGLRQAPRPLVVYIARLRVRYWIDDAVTHRPGLRIEPRAAWARTTQPSDKRETSWLLVLPGSRDAKFGAFSARRETAPKGPGLGGGDGTPGVSAIERARI